MSGPHATFGHAFISYVHEDASYVDILQDALHVAGVPVWRDTASLWPGQDWARNIRSAITRDSLVFIACFSRNSAARRSTYQNEELTVAIEQFRLRRPDEAWLIPVRFDDCQIPDLDIGGGRTLASIQSVDLFGDHAAAGMARLVAAVLRVLDRARDVAPVQAVAVPATDAPLDRPRPTRETGQAPTPGNALVTAEPAASPTKPGTSDYQQYEPAYVNYWPRAEGVVFNLTESTGGLVVYADDSMRGVSLKLWRTGYQYYANVVERTINGQREFAAVFASVASGQYYLESGSRTLPRVSVFAHQIAEVDLR